MDLPGLCSACGKAITNPKTCTLCGAMICEVCFASHKHDQRIQ